MTDMGSGRKTDKQGVQVKGTRGERRRRRRRTEPDRPPAEGEGNRVRDTPVCVCVCGKIVVQNLIFFAKGNSSLALLRRQVLSGRDDILETLFFIVQSVAANRCEQ